MSNFNEARSIAHTFYRVKSKEIEDKNEALEEVLKNVVGLMPDIDIEELRSVLLEEITAFIRESSMLKGEDKEHIPWYYDQKGKQPLRFWRRYERYLTEEKKWSEAVIQKSIDQTTDKIMDRLEDPKVKGRKFDRRGLVIGHIQSGKTANFTGLINKSVDMGYKLIIVLAGMHNSLRSQTQLRLDEEVLGYKTSILKLNADDSKLVGVSTLPGESFMRINTFTTRDDKGDFNKSTAKKIHAQPGVEPLILVVKKNKSVLENVLDFFRNDSLLAVRATGALNKTVPNVPLLMIDDEADQASINTSDIYDEDGNLIEEYNPTKINGLIREIYSTFEQRAYVGYTATPFANIFINDKAATEKYGDELFPKDFILSLPEPPNYMGADKFFKIEDNEDGEKIEDMWLIRKIQYHEYFTPLKHKKDHDVRELPKSLEEAMLMFVLSITIRRLRGQEKVHNSMLIHTSRFKRVQNEIYKLVSTKLNQIQKRIRYGETDIVTSYKEQLKELYYKDIIPTSEKYEAEIFSWEKVESELTIVLESIKVKEINGSSGDILDYIDHEETGLNVIAIGGDKLSRGLTLDGLTVSYYLRASKMYDTLMQMGRWFGYREGYQDLCRIYTTPELSRWFRHISEATEELRAEIEYMASIHATPMEFGLRVQTHPAMYITSQLKMRAGQLQKLSYRNSVSETTVFELNNELFKQNFTVVSNFIEKLGEPIENYSQKKRGKESKSKHLFWEEVPGKEIVSFLGKYKTAKTAPRANSEYLMKYIDKLLEYDELKKWTVCLINTGEKGEINDDYLPIGGHKILNGIVRSGDKSENENSESKTVSIKRLMSQDHEFLDFSSIQLEQKRRIEEDYDIQIETQKEDLIQKEVKSQKVRAEVRNPKEGLLIIYPIDHKKSKVFADKNVDGWPIGIALVFPDTKHTEVAVDYYVNKVFQELEGEND